MKQYRKPSSINYFGATGVVPVALAAAAGKLVGAALVSAIAGAVAVSAAGGGRSKGGNILAFSRQPALVPIC